MRATLLLMTAAAFAQQRPTFEVLSLKHAGDINSNITRDQGPATRPTNLRPLQFTPASVSCRVPLRTILMEAYQLKAYQIQAPEWTQTEVYEINARMSDGTSRETAQLMLRSALEDRLGMKARLEDKDTAIFRLVQIPGPDKLQKADVENQSSFRIGNNQFGGPAIPISLLANALTQAAGRPVIDETGRKGLFKLELHWESAGMTAGDGAGAGGPMRIGGDPGILAAIKDFGLKLEPAKKNMPFLTIDKINKEPTEN
jgi:uncharacterized protein (TIGR03435 family)